MANRISLDGTVFSPTTRYSQTTGKPILSFDLSFYDGKDQNKKTKYGSIRVVAFGALAENVAKYITEKDRYIVEGHLSQERWEKDGKKHYRLICIADDIGSAFNKFGDDRRAAGNGAPPPSDADIPDEIPDEEIPF